MIIFYRYESLFKNLRDKFINIFSIYILFLQRDKLDDIYG